MLPKWIKTFLAGALITLGTLELSACGDDNSSGASSIGSSDSSTLPGNPSLQGTPEASSSSSTDSNSAEIIMEICQVDLSTNVDPGLDLAACVAVPAPATTADIIFSKAGTRDNPEITATSGNGTQFAPISNGDLLPADDDYEVDMWPEDMNADRSPATAYVSDFKFKSTGTTLTNMIENSNQIYVALAPGYSTETGVGFYAFAITDAVEGNNGDYSITVKLYKVQ